MKDSVTKFDLSAAFKAFDELEYAQPDSKGLKPRRQNLKESYRNLAERRTSFDALFEDYYDVEDQNDLEQAAEDREGEIAQAKLARIEKIVDLDAKTADDLLPSYVGKIIIQCPQCMNLFYKNEEDIQKDEEDPTICNVNEPCQHCGNISGYTLIGKVDTVDEAEAAELTGETEEEPDALDLDLDFDTEEEAPAEEAEEDSEEEEDNTDNLDLDLDLNLEEEPAQESLNNSKAQKDAAKNTDLDTDNHSNNLSLNESAESITEDKRDDDDFYGKDVDDAVIQLKKSGHAEFWCMGGAKKAEEVKKIVKQKYGKDVEYKIEDDYCTARIVAAKKESLITEGSAAAVLRRFAASLNSNSTDNLTYDTAEEDAPVDESLTEAKRTIKPATLTPGDAGHNYEGYVDGSKWNGFESPCFTKEQADIIAKDYNAIAEASEITYDPTKDAFILTYEEDDEPEVFAGDDHMVDGTGEMVHVYPIGAWSWTWQLAESINEAYDSEIRLIPSLKNNHDWEDENGKQYKCMGNCENEAAEWMEDEEGNKYDVIDNPEVDVWTVKPRTAVNEAVAITISVDEVEDTVVAADPCDAMVIDNQPAGTELYDAKPTFEEPDFVCEFDVAAEDEFDAEDDVDYPELEKEDTDADDLYTDNEDDTDEDNKDDSDSDDVTDESDELDDEDEEDEDVEESLNKSKQKIANDTENHTENGSLNESLTEGAELDEANLFGAAKALGNAIKHPIKSVKNAGSAIGKKIMNWAAKGVLDNALSKAGVTATYKIAVVDTSKKPAVQVAIPDKYDTQVKSATTLDKAIDIAKLISTFSPADGSINCRDKTVVIAGKFGDQQVNAIVAFQNGKMVADRRADIATQLGIEQKLSTAGTVANAANAVDTATPAESAASVAASAASVAASDKSTTAPETDVDTSTAAAPAENVASSTTSSTTDTEVKPEEDDTKKTEEETKKAQLNAIISKLSPAEREIVNAALAGTNKKEENLNSSVKPVITEDLDSLTAELVDELADLKNELSIESAENQSNIEQAAIDAADNAEVTEESIESQIQSKLTDVKNEVKDTINGFKDLDKSTTTAVKEINESDDVKDVSQSEFASLVHNPDYLNMVEEGIDLDSLEEIDEESFNKCAEAYLKEVYTNVSNFELTKCDVKNSVLVMEGLITFKSGKTKLTNFGFTKGGTNVLTGVNESIAAGAKFVLDCTVNDNKLITESLSYTYKIKGNLVEGLVTRK